MIRLAIERDDGGHRSLVLRRGQTLAREVPSEGTEISLQEQVSAFWSELRGEAFSPALVQFVWAADRCCQLNAQNIASMPLRFQGSGPASTEPAWLSNPDPVWYPNGIHDAIFSAVDSFYRWGDAFLYVTDQYASGFPSAWTVLDASTMNVSVGEQSGRREFRIGENRLDPGRIVQISRNPRGGLRGTSALRSYADMVNASAAGTTAGREAFSNSPQLVLKSQVKLTQEQAEGIQNQWVARSPQRRLGIPPVLDPKLDLVGTNLGFSPRDMLLIDANEFNGRVLASAFGVPPFALNLPMTGGLTYQNPAMMRDHWWWSELHTTCVRIAAAFTAQMLPRGNAVVFDPTMWLHQGKPGEDLPLDSQTVDASPSQQENVSELRPAMGVTM